MADLLTDRLLSIVQRTGSSAGSLQTEAQRSAFVSSVRADLANIIDQLNNVYKPLASALSSTVSDNALDTGLAGTAIFTDPDATISSSSIYYSSSLTRPLLIKESLDTIISEINRLDNLIDTVVSADPYDDTDVRLLIGDATANIQQLVKDTMGTEYILEQDSEPNLTYSLAQAIDAIGAFFTGFPGTGNTYENVYPSLTLTASLANHASSHIRAGSDEIDGDRLDVDFSPTYYTKDSTAPTAGHADHLAAHLKGLDTGLGNIDLQKAYDNNANTSNTGLIALNATTGGIIVRDHGSNPDSYILDTQDASSNSILTVSDTGVYISNGYSLILEETPGITGIANHAQIGSYDIGGISELMAIDSAGNEVQITNAGYLAGSPLQSCYYVGSEIELDTDPIVFKDKATPITGGVLNVINNDDTNTYLSIDSNGFRLGEDIHIDLNVSSTDPSTVADHAMIYAKNDGTRVELYSKNGAGTVTKLTSNGSLIPHASSHISGGSDEVDGDKIDIDYTPTNYTSTITTPATDTAHLTAHLAGLDGAIGDHATDTGNPHSTTLQQVYTAGSDGSAGNLTLTEAKGKLSIRGWNDLTDVVVEVLGYDSANLITLDSSGIEAEVPLYLVGNGAQANRTGFGQLYVDLVTADNELFYKDDSGTAKQITSNGSINHTLQQAYTVAGSSGTAGRVVVTSGGGAFIVKSPDLDGTMQFVKFVDGDNGTMFEISSIRPKTYVPFMMFESAPIADETLAGQIYTENVSGITELFYRDDQGTDTQITGNGSISSHASSHVSGEADEIDGDELDIDYTPSNYTRNSGASPASSTSHLTAHLGGIDDKLAILKSFEHRVPLPVTIFRGHAAFAAPPLTDYTFAGGSGDKRHFGLAYDSSAFEYSYIYLTVPYDSSGNKLGNVKFRLHTVAPTYSSGSGWRFVASSYTTAIEDTDAIISTADVQGESITGLTSADIEKLYILETPNIAITSSSYGLIRVKIYRDVTHADDNWGSDVVLLHAEAIWSQ